MKNWDEEEIEAKARQFRREIGVDDLDWLDAATLIYKLKALIPRINYVLVDDHELPDPGGRWDFENKRLSFRKSVFYDANKLNPSPRARFTVAHEVTHGYLGHDGIRNRSAAGSLEKVGSRKTRRIESITDRFAVALLAPLHRIAPNEDAASIALRFGISRQAAEIRADEAARDYRRKMGLLRPIPDNIQDIIDQLRSGKRDKR